MYLSRDEELIKAKKIKQDQKASEQTKNKQSKQTNKQSENLEDEGKGFFYSRTS